MSNSDEEELKFVLTTHLLDGSHYSASFSFREEIDDHLADSINDRGIWANENNYVLWHAVKRIEIIEY